MASKRGRDILLRIGDGGGPETFSIIGGTKIKEFDFRLRPVDSTHRESSGGWRELLDQDGFKSLRLVCQGNYRATASEEILRARAFAAQQANCEFVLPSLGTWSGAFLVTELRYFTRLIGEAQFRATFESAGAITWTGV